MLQDTRSKRAAIQEYTLPCDYSTRLYASLSIQKLEERNNLKFKFKLGSPGLRPSRTGKYTPEYLAHVSLSIDFPLDLSTFSHLLSSPRVSQGEANGRLAFNENWDYFLRRMTSNSRLISARGTLIQVKLPLSFSSFGTSRWYFD